MDFSDENEAPGVWRGIMSGIRVKLGINRAVLDCMRDDHGSDFEVMAQHFLPVVQGLYLNSSILRDLTHSMVRQV